MEQMDTANAQEPSKVQSEDHPVGVECVTDLKTDTTNNVANTTLSDGDTHSKSASTIMSSTIPVTQHDNNRQNAPENVSCYTSDQIESSEQCLIEIKGDDKLVQDAASDQTIKNNIATEERGIAQYIETTIDNAPAQDGATNCAINVESGVQKEDLQTSGTESVCTILNMDSAGANSTQCQDTLKSNNEGFQTAEHSVRVESTELTKLVDGNSEVVVLTVETIPTVESNVTTEENYVVTVHEEEENIVSLGEKYNVKKTNVATEQFNVIECSQEANETIIEVISTEVIQSEVAETATLEDKRENQKSPKNEVTNETTVSSAEEQLNIVQSVDNNNTKEDVKEQVHIQDEKVTEPNAGTNKKTEVCDNKNKSNLRTEVRDVEEHPSPNADWQKETNSFANKVDKIQTPNKNRSVIQDIFDDWGVENVEEETPVVPKVQDSVEIQLENLLDDAKVTDTITEKTVVVLAENADVALAHKDDKSNDDCEILHMNIEKQENKKHLEPKEVELLNKSRKIPDKVEKVSKSIKRTTQDSEDSSKSSQVETSTPMSRNRPLTSHIASPVEVAEALKERLKEKQKLIEPPPGPDKFFVKKLTQRLSSRLAGTPINPVPALIPIPNPAQPSANNCERKSTDHTTSGSEKESNSDNKELLAILEGDVDPDWSNLKPPTLTQESKSPIQAENLDSPHNTPPKLDPLVERELALKQLLELPVAGPKKNASKKKKSVKPSAQKTVKQPEGNKDSAEIEIVSIDLSTVQNGPPVKDIQVDTAVEEDAVNSKEETGQQKISDAVAQDTRLDESRSGRKRKPTEKAREHEQTTKRQKLYKTRIPPHKKPSEESEVDNSITVEDVLSKENEEPSNVNTDPTPVEIGKDTPMESISNDTVVEKSDTEAAKRSKQSLSKKGSQSVAKKKVVVKKLVVPNVSTTKKTVNVKAKLNSTAQKKSGTKLVSKSQKRLAESGVGDSKPKKKVSDEIDRLLQDEGVVNLLYDVEQPDKKRLVPITKSQAKVMDIQKVQRELKIRKKLVRNAVMRLRSSGSGVSTVSPRSKRTSQSSVPMRKSDQQIPPSKALNTVAPEFIIPAKIRNAADASVIVRRHSSSSFSSASGSPRVSIDGPEKNDAGKEETLHTNKSNRRRHSQDDKPPAKKTKKKKTENPPASVATEEKTVFPSRAKKLDGKKVEKNAKPTDSSAADDSDTSSSKVVTRSNGTTGKIMSKSKKFSRSKMNFVKASETDNTEESSKEEDELSACLAEAATALSVVSANNRSGNAAVSRKNKAAANVAKTSEVENSKQKPEARSQFINKEINVRRHGNLVQLILTPSTTTKIRNALTLQVMQEFRDTLSILKKDDECRVVLFTSTGTSFCEGLELSDLLRTNKDDRRFKAHEMADAVKDFIKSLASFNKPIVAGVQGAAVGLGVTMLPLFDLVIASDKATFCTPYGKLGQIAEGAAVFTLSHILGSAITSELLLGGRTLTASEALRAGLVTRVLWPDRFQVELIPTLKAMSEQSPQSMEATKALLRHSLRNKLDAALESETYLLIQHWCSAECQNGIKVYLDGKIQ